MSMGYRCFICYLLYVYCLQVFMVALLFSLIFKKSDLIDEVAEEDEEELALGNDENWLHPTPGDIGTLNNTRGHLLGITSDIC